MSVSLDDVVNSNNTERIVFTNSGSNLMDRLEKKEERLRMIINTNQNTKKFTE
jgi:hypothetical protein